MMSLVIIETFNRERGEWKEASRQEIDSLPKDKPPHENWKFNRAAFSGDSKNLITVAAEVFLEANGSPQESVLPNFGYVGEEDGYHYVWYTPKGAPADGNRQFRLRMA